MVGRSDGADFASKYRPRPFDHHRQRRARTHSVSADGRWVTFTAFDDPRIAGDTNRARDAFVRDLASSALINLSLDLPRFGRGRHPLISVSGNAAVFLVETNFDNDDVSGDLRYYHKHLVTGLVTLVDPVPVQRGSPDMLDLLHAEQAISADGNLVVYERDNARLYLRDIAAGTNQLITVTRFGGPASRGSGNALLSPDSRYAVFHNSGGDLVPNPPSGSYSNLYARDLSLGLTFLISADTNGAGLLGHSVATSFSASGRYLVFFGTYQGAAGPLVSYLYDFETRRATAICSDCTHPYLSADGRFVAFRRQRPFFSIRDVYVLDLSSGATELATENITASGGGNGTTFAPTLSGDGRYVVFASKASDLALNDTNNASDIFVRDRWRGVTLLLSMAGNAASSKPIMSPDGRTVVFQSFAGDLISGDYNRGLDIFAERLGAGDSDNDGMDDNWEQTYFNNLDRDGTGDLDSDAQTDLAEYFAGTDPTNLESVFEVLAIESTGTQKRLVWSAVPGKRYIVQSKSALSLVNWQNLTQPIAATATTASLTITSTGPDQAFYRVRVLP